MNAPERKRIESLVNDLQWILNTLLPRVDEEMPCGWMDHEECNRLTAARSNVQKMVVAMVQKQPGVYIGGKKVNQ